MRTTNTFGIHFILRKSSGKDEHYTIYARISVDGLRVEISLKRPMLPDNWDEIKGRAKGNKSEFKNLNHYLDEVRTRLMEHYQELQLSQELITAETLKNMFLGLGQSMRWWRFAISPFQTMGL